jgi:hypothetical protein
MNKFVTYIPSHSLLFISVTGILQI